eukprot:UN23435
MEEVHDWPYQRTLFAIGGAYVGGSVLGMVYGSKWIDYIKNSRGLNTERVSRTDLYNLVASFTFVILILFCIVQSLAFGLINMLLSPLSSYLV